MLHLSKPGAQRGRPPQHDAALIEEYWLSHLGNHSMQFIQPVVQATSFSAHLSFPSLPFTIRPTPPGSAPGYTLCTIGNETSVLLESCLEQLRRAMKLTHTWVYPEKSCHYQLFVLSLSLFVCLWPFGAALPPTARASDSRRPSSPPRSRRDMFFSLRDT